MASQRNVRSTNTKAVHDCNAKSGIRQVTALVATRWLVMREWRRGGEAIAALREAGRWPETGTLETGAGTAASKPKEKAEAPWRKLTDFRRC